MQETESLLHASEPLSPNANILVTPPIAADGGALGVLRRANTPSWRAATLIVELLSGILRAADLSWFWRRMSALGHKQTFRYCRSMSASLPKADTTRRDLGARFGP